MSRLSGKLLITAVLLLSLGACSPKTQPNPFVVSRDEIFAKVDTVAVLPMVLENGLSAPDEFHETVSQLITERIEKAGFEAVASEAEGVDVFLQPSVVATSAPWYQGTAEWHGVKAPVGGGERTYWGLFKSDGFGYEGNISATSLRVTIKDSGDQIYYDQYAGLELLSKLEDRFLGRPSFEPVPSSELFRHAQHTKTAVELALEGLVGG